MNGATTLHVEQSLAQNLDPVIDQSPVGLELRFTGAAHADTAAEFLEVGPHAREARQHVLELRELHLHLRFRRTRPRGKDVQDQLGPIHHAFADRVFDVLALRRRKLFVEQHERCVELLDAQAELLELSFAEVCPGVRPVDLLRQLTDDHGARGIGQVGQLAEMVVGHAARAWSLERSADEKRALHGRGNDDRFAAYVRILVVEVR